ncbi:hypothetical protein COLO4_00569 [Corchorus olitorius]|uniref:Uncharacterized protein n=1 Tax=Corchorus olitorius TaxID=93759 RepID=A0A1R3L3T8_9ROSI|nr:hypothetical protein COLO4_00569 [Corchorus olitorius]
MDAGTGWHRAAHARQTCCCVPCAVMALTRGRWPTLKCAARYGSITAGRACSPCSMVRATGVAAALCASAAVVLATRCGARGHLACAAGQPVADRCVSPDAPRSRRGGPARKRLRPSLYCPHAGHFTRHGAHAPQARLSQDQHAQPVRCRAADARVIGAPVGSCAPVSGGGHLWRRHGRRAVLEEGLQLRPQLGRIGVLVHGNGVLHGRLQQFGIAVGADGDRAVGLAGEGAAIDVAAAHGGAPE